VCGTASVVADPVRVVAVLGYSGRRSDVLDPICVVRLRRAEQLAAGARAVVLSGWARRPSGRSEAELMRAAWGGPEVPLLCDTTARSTVENAVAVAAASRELDADEVVVVTSNWHELRARVLVRAALRGSGIGLRTSPTPGPLRVTVLVRELACLVALPVQVLLLLRLRRRRPWERSSPSSYSSS
jgi:uncharacterized SAM-binding protein YcdF (DUF218 family)